MTFSTYDEKTACITYFNCLFLYLGTELVIQFPVDLSCLDYSFIISFSIAYSFVDDIFLVSLLAHFCLSLEFSVTAEDNVSASSGHVGSDSNRTELTGLSNDLSFLFMLLCVEDAVLDTLLLEESRELF